MKTTDHSYIFCGFVYPHCQMFPTIFKPRELKFTQTVHVFWSPVRLPGECQKPNMNKTFPLLWTSAPESHQIDFCSPPDKQVCIQHHLCLLVLWSVFLLQTDFFLLYILHKLTWANNGTWRVCVFVYSISCQLLTKCSTHQGNWFFLFFFPSHLCNVAFRK